MDRHDRGARQRERQRVLEVTERRAELPEQARQRHRQPQLLERRPEPHGLDSLGDEAGVARDGGDPNSGSGRQRRQLAQEVEHVRLVARALAAEDVGIDDDERSHASSRQTASTRSATDAHV